MRCKTLSIALITLVSNFAFAGTAKVVPTTTLAAETGNNTSAANNFPGEVNGNAAATNVSKLPISSLLYPGARTEIYAQVQPWFGTASHVNVGYNSSDPAQVKRQVKDMMSRGIAGAIVDWYGPAANFNLENQTTLNLMSEAEAQGGAFTFAINEDGGALQACAATSGCDVTQKLVADLTYAATAFENSPAYMRVNNRPVVTFFGTEYYAVDWSRVRVSVPGNPLFVFENSGGFSWPQSGGGFGWVQPGTVTSTNPIAAQYLDDFYRSGQASPQDITIGAAYKGFNDSIAAWSGHRVMAQNCGQTWIESMAEVGKFYSIDHPLDYLQIVTWNDYEEGTEVESGIDPCVSISASVTNGSVNWLVSGSEIAVDHYTVFISSDGQNLMSLGNIPTGVYSLNLAQFGLAPGTYSVYVEAVGKASIQNRITTAAAYRIDPPIVTPKLVLSPGTQNLSVNASTSDSIDVGGTISNSIVTFGDGTVADGPSATHSYARPGTYTVTATVYDLSGLAATTSQTITAQGPAIPYIQILAPTANSTTSSPVHVVANGYAPLAIIATQIYVDSLLVYQANTGSVDTMVTMSSGGHYVVVQIWQNNGVVTKQPLNIITVR